jgi:hypothetical protein
MIHNIIKIMSEKSKTFLVGRDSRTGEFVSANKVYSHPDRYVVERIPKSASIPKQLRYIVSPPKKSKASGSSKKKK